MLLRKSVARLKFQASSKEVARALSSPAKRSLPEGKTFSILIFFITGFSAFQCMCCFLLGGSEENTAREPNFFRYIPETSANYNSNFGGRCLSDFYCISRKVRVFVFLVCAGSFGLLSCEASDDSTKSASMQVETAMFECCCFDTMVFF